MRCIIPLITIFTSHVLAIGLVNGGGQLNGLEKRQSYDYCGADVYGIDYFCYNSLCCVGNSAWSCVGVNDQCCATGYMCPDGTQCYLDSFDEQVCVSGSTTHSASVGQPAQTSSGQPTQTSFSKPAQTSSSQPAQTSSSQPAQTTSIQPTQTLVPSSSATRSPGNGADATRRIGYVFAALVLVMSAMLFG